jgi:hypothetical protein
MAGLIPPLYEAESVNRSQMDIKRKTRDIRTWGKNYFSTYPPPTLIQLFHRFTSESKPAAHNSFQPLLHQRNVFHPTVNRFTRQTLPTVNRKYLFMNILCFESFCSQKTYNRIPITSITDVLFPFLAYLLTLPRSFQITVNKHNQFSKPTYFSFGHIWPK